MRPFPNTLRRCTSVQHVSSRVRSLGYRRALPISLSGLPIGNSLGKSRSFSHSPLSTRSTLIDLLHIVDDKREIQTYLSGFRLGTPQRLAIVAIGEGSISSEDITTISQSLSFLKEVGLFPIILHGALAASGSNTSHIGTSHLQEEGSQPQPGVSARILEFNTQLVSALEDLGVHARPITSGIFAIDKYLSSETSKLSTSARTSISTHSIEAALKAGCIPVLPCLGETFDGQILGIDVDLAAAQLGIVLRPWRVVFLTGDAVENNNKEMVEARVRVSGRIPSIVNLNHELNLSNTPKEQDEERIPKNELPSTQPEGTIFTIPGHNDLLHDLTRSSNVFLGQLSDLPCKGRGILIQRGEKVNIATCLAEFPDIAHIKRILMRETKLDWRLARPLVDDYIKTLETQPFIAYFNDAHSDNLAIVHLDPDANKESQEAELAIFSISQHGWLNYVADQIWTRISQNHASLLWKVPIDDENIDWWFKRAEGCGKSDGEVRFWYGNTARLEECVFGQEFLIDDCDLEDVSTEDGLLAFTF